MEGDEKMKICYLADIRSIHTKRWIEYFAKEHEVDLITLAYTKKEDTFVPEEVYKMMNVRVHKVSKPMPFLLLAPFKIRRLIKKINPDIVHAHYVTQYGFCGAFSGFHPLIISAWGSDVLVDPDNSMIFKLMVKFALKEVDLITCNGENLKEAMTNMIEDSQKIKIIYHGVDIKNFNSSKRDKAIIKSLFKGDFPTVISIRGLEPIYNVESLIKAIPLVLKLVPDAKFIIANNGSQEAHLKEMAKSLDIWNNVKFVGLIQHNELPKYLASSDIYVSTSLSDGGAVVSTLEAMACGLAPVVTDSGDHRKLIKSGENGFVVPVKNSKALSEKIIYLLENGEYREEIKKKNLEIIKAKFDWNENMKRIEEKYRAIVSH